ncbi:hypothetical protein CCMA1212_005973 [Trichoderma ghanense]|uniref:Uncharacterized protein n=1 Tax=Trichoderma ghanense TaxID=65468 RepID=A0ABY2H5U4_9HYPO
MLGQLSHQTALISPLRILRQLRIQQVRKLLDLVQRHLRALNHQRSLYRPAAQLRDLAYLAVLVEAKRAAGHPQLLLEPRRVHDNNIALVAEEVKRRAERRVQPAERDGLALRGRVDGQRLALDAGVGLAEVPQGGDDGEARAVDEVAVGGEHVQVDADGPALLAGHQAQRLRVQGARPADRLLEEPGEEDLGLGWPVDFVRGRDHGAELGCDLEDAVKGTVREGDCDLC